MLGWEQVRPGVLQKDKYSLVFLVYNRVSVREYGNEIIKMNYEDAINMVIS